MFSHSFIFAGLAVIVVAFPGCGTNGAPSAPIQTSQDDPKSTIARHVKLIQAGDIDLLRGCFTERLREGITPKAVEAGQKEVARYTLDDLVGAVEVGEHEGKRTAQIKMKNGRSLTTLVFVEERWLADTIWFR
jgi:hypothetical protein